MAATGDVDGLWAIFRNADAASIDWEEVFGLFLRAIEVRCRADPALFAGEMLARVFGLTSFLVLRTHHYASRLIAVHDRSGRGRGSAELPRELTELVLPRLLELQTHLADIAHAQASVCRLWELAKCKRAENQRASSPPSGSRVDECPGSGDPGRTMNGTTEETCSEGGGRQTQEEGGRDGQRSTCWQGVAGDKVGTDRPED
jgi:hypothetical protein